MSAVTTRASRMLIPEPHLIVLRDKADEGMPVSALMRNLAKEGFTISRPTLRSLIQYFKLVDNVEKSMAETMLASLFPSWLNETDKVQASKTNWSYTGRFPYGFWSEDG